LLWVGLILEHSYSADFYTQYHPYYRLLLLTTFLRRTHRELEVVLGMIPVRTMLHCCFGLMVWEHWR